MGRSGERDQGGALKTTLVVVGGLALGWLTMETAFKPFLDRLRAAITRSDPARDPDDVSAPTNLPEADPIRHGEDEVEEKDRETKSSD
ncbi:putative outer envelope membrane protein [Dioscorea sansibarensis]